jgi:hypothetical protein
MAPAITNLLENIALLVHWKIFIFFEQQTLKLKKLIRFLTGVRES